MVHTCNLCQEAEAEGSQIHAFTVSQEKDTDHYYYHCFAVGFWNIRVIRQEYERKGIWKMNKLNDQ